MTTKTKASELNKLKGEAREKYINYSNLKYVNEQLADTGIKGTGKAVYYLKDGDGAYMSSKTFAGYVHNRKIGYKIITREEYLNREKKELARYKKEKSREQLEEKKQELREKYNVSNDTPVHIVSNESYQALKKTKGEGVIYNNEIYANKEDAARAAVSKNFKEQIETAEERSRIYTALQNKKIESENKEKVLRESKSAFDTGASVIVPEGYKSEVQKAAEQSLKERFKSELSSKKGLPPYIKKGSQTHEQLAVRTVTPVSRDMSGQPATNKTPFMSIKPEVVTYKEPLTSKVTFIKSSPSIDSRIILTDDERKRQNAAEDRILLYQEKHKASMERWAPYFKGVNNVLTLGGTMKPPEQRKTFSPIKAVQEVGQVILSLPYGLTEYPSDIFLKLSAQRYSTLAPYKNVRSEQKRSIGEAVKVYKKPSTYLIAAGSVGIGAYIQNKLQPVKIPKDITYSMKQSQGKATTYKAFKETVKSQAALLRKDTHSTITHNVDKGPAVTVLRGKVGQTTVTQVSINNKSYIVATRGAKTTVYQQAIIKGQIIGTYKTSNVNLFGNIKTGKSYSYIDKAPKFIIKRQEFNKVYENKESLIVNNKQIEKLNEVYQARTVAEVKVNNKIFRSDSRNIVKVSQSSLTKASAQVNKAGATINVERGKGTEVYNIVFKQKATAPNLEPGKLKAPIDYTQAKGNVLMARPGKSVLTQGYESLRAPRVIRDTIVKTQQTGTQIYSQHKILPPLKAPPSPQKASANSIVFQNIQARLDATPKPTPIYPKPTLMRVFAKSDQVSVNVGTVQSITPHISSQTVPASISYTAYAQKTPLITPFIPPSVKTYQDNKIKASINPQLAILPNLKTSTGLITSINIDQKINPIQKVSPTPSQIISPIETLDYSTTQKTGSITDVMLAQEQILITNEVTTVKNEIGSIRANINPPVTPRLITPNHKPFPGFSGESTQKKEKGYNVLMIERGRQVKANNQPLPRKEAERLGRDIADNSLSASFKVTDARTKVPSARRSKLATGMNVSPGKFTQSKSRPGYFVEKAKHRLDTIGEKKGITAARLITERKKAIFGKTKGGL